MELDEAETADDVAYEVIGLRHPGGMPLALSSNQCREASSEEASMEIADVNIAVQPPPKSEDGEDLNAAAAENESKACMSSDNSPNLLLRDFLTLRCLRCNFFTTI